jgi:putative drug exporter of the RND superfamily
MTAAPRALRWLVPALLLVAWLGLGGVVGPYAGKLGEVAVNDQTAFLPKDAESTRVLEAQQEFREDRTIPAIIVWTAEDGTVSPEQRQAAAGVLQSLAKAPAVTGEVSPVIPSRDGEAMQGVLQLRSDLDDAAPRVVGEFRETAGRVPGTTAYVGGPAATQADLSDAFAGIDGLLLGVALGVVLLILLLVYRSVLLPLVIIVSAVFALSLASALVYVLAERDVVRVDGQVQGILSILVIGAATDYALLLSARFREELARTDGDRFAAMRTAVRRSAGAIVASAGTVGLGLLALLLSDLANNRALGPVGAIGIACAVVATMTFLPAVLALLGPAAYWPARVQRAAAGPDRSGGVWGRIAALVARTPRRLWAGTLAALLACTAFAPQLTSDGVPLSEIFVNEAPSVTAQEVLGAHYPGGSGNPAVLVADAGAVRAVTRTAAGTEGVTGAAPLTASGRPGAGEPKVVDGRVLVDATLADSADSDAAEQTVLRLRTNLHGLEGADVLVGGYTAQQYDTQQAAQRDRAVITPVVLVIILVILALLLRALLMPVLLVATVALNYFATVGVAALVFEHWFGFSGTDASVPLYGFVFLVALGVDYNIFLMTRVREEALREGTRTGVLTGLTATGGVITSAGVVLAATFAALGVIPLAFLVQIAFIVAFGVLLDTLVVRSLLVPALVRDIGPVLWWPSSLRHRDGARDGEPRSGPAPAAPGGVDRSAP